MASRAPQGPFIIYVKFDLRDDGGLRATCDKVPGFLLSHHDHSLVRADVAPALEMILSEMYGLPMLVQPVGELGDEDQPTLPSQLVGRQSYLGQSASH